MISFKDLIVCVLLLHIQSAQGKNARLNLMNNFILNGKPLFKPIPYHVSIQFFNRTWEHRCSGSIIDERSVLTAASCFDYYYNIRKWTVLAGTVSKSAPGPRYGTKWIVTHPEFTSLLWDNIAILRVNKTFTWSESIEPIKLFPANGPIGHLFQISGWGRMNKNSNNMPDKLHYQDVRLMDYQDCYAHWIIGGDHICTDPGKDRGACDGDLGGPLTQSGLLYGFLAYGSDNCGDGLPDVYTRVESYLYWIEKEQTRGDHDPPRP